MIAVLKGIMAGDEMDPVPVIQLPEPDPLVQLPYRYCVRDGYHRFYASMVAGFECLPTSIETLGEVLQQSRNLGWRA